MVLELPTQVLNFCQSLNTELWFFVLPSTLFLRFGGGMAVLQWHLCNIIKVIEEVTKKIFDRTSSSLSLFSQAMWGSELGKWGVAIQFCFSLQGLWHGVGMLFQQICFLGSWFFKFFFVNIKQKVGLFLTRCFWTTIPVFILHNKLLKLCLFQWLPHCFLPICPSPSALLNAFWGHLQLCTKPNKCQWILILK